MASAYVHQGARNRSHHVVEKAIGFHFHADVLADALDCKLCYGPDARVAIGPFRFKAVKIVFPT